MLSSHPSAHDRRRSKEPQRIRTGARMLVACIYCKEHKLRCDNGVPACASCVRFSQTCLVEDPITKRHQPRNYLEILETRVAYLEGLLRDGQTQTQRHTQAPTPCTTGSPTWRLPRTNVTATDKEADDDNDNNDNDNDNNDNDNNDSDVDGLAATVGMLGLCATGMEPRYLGSSSAFAFSRAIGTSLLLRDAGSGRPCLGARPGMPMPMPIPGDMHRNLPTAPTYEEGLVLSNAYFENIHIQYPFLHEPTFRLWEVQRVSSVPPVPLSESESDLDMASFFVYMVYAIGALLLPTTRHDPEQLYALAMRSMDGVLHRDNLQSVQALLACCVYSLRSPSGPSVWKLTGLALRQCIELGYHRTAQRSVGARLGSVQIELRKRAFWTAFAIDCSVALFLGRPFGVSLWDIDVELPQNMGDGSVFADAHGGTGLCAPAPDLSVALHMFRLRRLWAQIHVALFSDSTTRVRIRTTDAAYTARIQQLQAALDAWRAAAPPAPPRTGAALTLFGSPDWYDTNYHHSILLLHRNHLVEARAAVPAPVVHACLDATERIARGYYRQFVLGRVGCTWGCLHVLFLAGLTYLHSLWTSPAARAARSLSAVSSTCMDCSMVLAVMAARWTRAAAYRDMFETLSRKTMAMLAGDGMNGGDINNNKGSPDTAAWLESVEASTLAAESSGLDDPWEVMQWINEDALTEAPETFAFT
ncbi:hypothetical protein HMPREF1624_06622 [Sporothrix schenckii ATCC 58251]|uniref:Zn(2)-C6 fungal-type domain-containing protein n=1 Tax=Sporothrix schenckii (strain ATCC 58251 / de Perez 2211183) TaxID=1391915 RepID=U7PS36_SPOS1|nr:hypothetical protein HMPREF1624_06622 [Sporothrix schenckii ATCC 58251]